MLSTECLDALKRLTTKCQLTLMWVPCHTGITRNKIANQLANKDSEVRFIGPKFFTTTLKGEESFELFDQKDVKNP
jgi:ribonuclease HI